MPNHGETLCDARFRERSTEADLEAMYGRKSSRFDLAASGKEESLDPTLWEYALGRQVSEARAACHEGLKQIPTGLGRLAYLAVLQHRLLGDHEELFGEWLSCSLQQKYEWLYRLAVSASYNGALPDEWLSTETYSDLVPQTVEGSARKLYLAEIEAVLEILRNELAGECGPPKTSGLAGEGCKIEV